MWTFQQLITIARGRERKRLRCQNLALPPPHLPLQRETAHLPRSGPRPRKTRHFLDPLLLPPSQMEPRNPPPPPPKALQNPSSPPKLLLQRFQKGRLNTQQLPSPHQRLEWAASWGWAPRPLLSSRRPPRSSPHPSRRRPPIPVPGMPTSPYSTPRTRSGPRRRHLIGSPSSPITKDPGPPASPLAMQSHVWSHYFNHPPPGFSSIFFNWMKN